MDTPTAPTLDTRPETAPMASPQPPRRQLLRNVLGFALAFGLLGLALATPIAAVGVTLTQLLYVHGYLGREPGRGPPA